MRNKQEYGKTILMKQVDSFRVETLKKLQYTACTGNGTKLSHPSTPTIATFIFHKVGKAWERV
jgi:hypothetical protein